MYRRTIAAALLAGAIAVGAAGTAIACPPGHGGRESNEAHHHAMPGHHGQQGHHGHHGQHGSSAPHGSGMQGMDGMNGMANGMPLGR